MHGRMVLLENLTIPKSEKKKNFRSNFCINVEGLINHELAILKQVDGQIATVVKKRNLTAPEMQINFSL